MLTRLGKTAGIEPVQTVDVPPLTERTALHDITTTHASWPKKPGKVRLKI